MHLFQFQEDHLSLPQAKGQKKACNSHQHQKTRVTFRKITFKVDISEPFLAGNSLSLIMRLVEMFRMFSGYGWYDPKKSKDLSSFNT